MQKEKVITLKHIYVAPDRYIGLKFYPDKVLQAMVKELPDPKWHPKSSCVIIKNNRENLNKIFQKFIGVAWVDTKQFFKKKAPDNNIPKAAQPVFGNGNSSKKTQPRTYSITKACPEIYIDKLKTLNYSYQTIKTYSSMFIDFINYYPAIKPESVTK
ncbi:MAG: hypothetical protein KTR26_01865, partial [Flammeovirgaceae bacterium]|nr:hypothetical protein [Flammeovirgaceae bacterium]